MASRERAGPVPRPAPTSEKGSGRLKGGDTRRKPLERLADQTADRLVRGGPAPHATVAPDARAPTMGAGEALGAAERAYFEPRLGHNLSAIRIHTGPAAAATAHRLGVQAFAVGPDLGFAPGRFAPDTAHGRWLLAHELAHATDPAAQQPGAPAVLGYEGPEHRDLGDRFATDLLAFLQTEEGAAWAKKLGFDAKLLAQQMKADPFVGSGKKIQVRKDLALTPGEIIALAGDLYAGPNAIATADAKEVKKLLEVIELQGEHKIEGKIANLRFEKISGGRYTRLAKKNSPHFAPKNRTAWRDLHEKAMDHARKNTGDAGLQRAYLMDAAGNHFLTDAFAAGHLLDVAQVEAAIAMHLHGRTLDTSANPEMATIIGALQVSGLAIKLVLKNIHDRMNREGFEIKNKAGMTWKTYGDDHLKTSQETQRIAALAVFLSRQQITEAAAGKQPKSAKVEALLPNDDSVKKATQYAISLIPKAASGQEVVSLIHGQTPMLRTLPPVVGPIAESWLDTISSPGRLKQLEEAQKNKTLAPQFTIFKF